MANKQEETREQPMMTAGEIERQKWIRDKEAKRIYDLASEGLEQARDLVDGAEKKAAALKDKATKAAEEAAEADKEFLDALLKFKVAEEEQLSAFRQRYY